MLCILIVAWYSLQVTFQLPFPIPHTFGHDYLAWVRMTSRPYPMPCLGWHPGQLQKMLVDGSGAIKGLRNHYTDFYELHLTTKASTKLCGAPHNSHSLSGSMVQLSSSLEARISCRGRQALGEAALFCPGLLPAACGELPQLWGQGASILAQNLQLMNRTWFAPGKSLFLPTVVQWSLGPILKPGSQVGWIQTTFISTLPPVGLVQNTTRFNSACEVNKAC